MARASVGDLVSAKEFLEISSSKLVLWILLCLVLYAIALGIYRVYFHPLAKFPGPKIAAATYLYEWYFELVKSPGGQYFKKIDQFHDQYGPIVRINPKELHVRDFEFLDTLYPQAMPKRDKYSPAVEALGVCQSAFGTVDHDLHRKRRSATNKMFSKRAIETAWPIFQDQLKDLCGIFERALETGDWIDIGAVFLSFTTDSIMRYMFNTEGRYLKNQAMAAAWKDLILLSIDVTPFTRQFPWMFPLIEKSPPSIRAILVWLKREIGTLFDLHQYVARVVDDHFKTIAMEKQSGFEEPVSESNIKPRSVLHAIETSHLPPGEKGYERLRHESIVMMLAGSETTATVLSMMMYLVACNPDIQAKVRQEVNDAAGESDRLPDMRALECLPWLNGVIREALRIRVFMITRLPRIAHEDMWYGDWRIPAGTPVGMSAKDYLLNGEIYPEPLTCKPERWFEPNEMQNKAFIPFSKGTRNCLGMNFAYDEMRIITATIATRFTFQPYDTTWERDVMASRDCMMGAPHRSSKGIRFKIMEDNKRFVFI